MESGASLERANVAGDPQIVVPAMAFRIYALWAAGDEGAEPLALELVAAAHREPLLPVAHDWFPELAVPMAALGRGEELESVAVLAPTATLWLEGGLAIGRGDPLAAAEIFRRIGARPFEAEARLLAAKDGHDADLPSAIEFFREVEATAFLREAEAVPVRSRSA